MTEQKKSYLSEHTRQRTQEWFRKAEHELAYLNIAPLDADDPPTDTTCRMAHMVGEYSLKAYLMVNQHKIMKSHDLVAVLDECISIHHNLDFETLRGDCKILTQYRSEMTYPGPFPVSVSIEEARAAIDMAKQVYEFVLEKTRELGYYERKDD